MTESKKVRIKRGESPSKRDGLEKAAVRPHKVEGIEGSTSGFAIAPASHASSTHSASSAEVTSSVDIEKTIQSFMKSLPDGCTGSVLWGSKVTKKEAAARKYFGVPSKEEIWLILDTTIFGSCKVGLALCTGGMRFHDERGEDGCLSWKKVATCSLKADGGTLVVSGYRFVTSSDTEDLMRLFHKLQKELAK